MWGCLKKSSGELPPRTRRILRQLRVRGSRSGTTSAYAENTGQNQHQRYNFRNYLRVRGEYV